ncbi:hypothetical protein SAMN02745673_00382 [Marinactinospora thermotolerans DSM 45154]|uniref:Uncharacterized protein n=1 Tax=Marinactinospora thermotolerans DSM 45154 TaxID=1122192 RepID=A0A1T4KHG8_9ACTN|nr:hypothetical protein SAMN02745673_00382 [Marinactinospora thermotolerans DSM 45154]
MTYEFCSVRWRVRPRRPVHVLFRPVAFKDVQKRPDGSTRVRGGLCLAGAGMTTLAVKLLRGDLRSGSIWRIWREPYAVHGAGWPRQRDGDEPGDLGALLRPVLASGRAPAVRVGTRPSFRSAGPPHGLPRPSWTGAPPGGRRPGEGGRTVQAACRQRRHGPSAVGGPTSPPQPERPGYRHDTRPWGMRAAPFRRPARATPPGRGRRPPARSLGASRADAGGRGPPGGAAGGHRPGHARTCPGSVRR